MSAVAGRIYETAVIIPGHVTVLAGSFASGALIGHRARSSRIIVARHR